MGDTDSDTFSFDFYIDASQKGLYLTVPFEMPVNVERFSLAYDYPTHRDEVEKISAGRFLSHTRINTIDLGLISPADKQVGASGSDKNRVTISETDATPGYQPHPLTPGTWHILVGAYRVAPEGVTVHYEITYYYKKKRLLMGDPHVHTISSDGLLPLDQLAHHARSHGLDFLCVTDHNQSVEPGSLPFLEGLTLIPGIEWTHYKGHANFLGINRPYDEPFFTNEIDQVQARFRSAQERGALIVINHPCDDICCAFTFDMSTLPYDCLEVWNGPMRPSNLNAIGLWQNMLIAGKKIPAICGSDYHRDALFQILGGPSLGVWSLSSSPADILMAMRNGHCFLTFQPDGPRIDLRAEEAIMGDSLTWQPGSQVSLKIKKMISGDTIRIVTASKNVSIFTAPSHGAWEFNYPVEQPGFVRVELWRTFLPGVPALPALLSNPIYFE